MNSRIKTLLKLSSIPNFRLSKEEELELQAWKDEQEHITPKRKTRSKASKIASKPSEDVETVNDAPAIEKVQNVITPDELTLNELES